jgi:hypothetical protein
MALPTSLPKVVIKGLDPKVANLSFILKFWHLNFFKLGLIVLNEH